MKSLASMSGGVEGCFSHVCQYVPQSEVGIELVQACADLLFPWKRDQWAAGVRPRKISENPECILCM